MGKIDDYNFIGLPQQLIDFKEQVREILNFGTYQFVVSSSAPTFTTKMGQQVYYRSGTAGRLYVYMGSSWNLVTSFTADAS